MTTTQRPFEARPSVESRDYLENADGAIVVADIREFACLHLGGLAAVVPASAREVRLYDSGSGDLSKVVRIEHAVDAIQWSPHGTMLAALGRDGDSPGGVTIVDVAGGGGAAVVARDAHLAATGFAWSDADRFCWLSAERAAATDGFAELWCYSAKDGAASVKRAAWAGDGAHPWIGFRRNDPHLCGDELRPKDVDCLGLTRPPN